MEVVILSGNGNRTTRAMPLEQQAFLELARAQCVLSAELVALLKEHGLSESLYNVLRILRGAGDAPLRVQEIWQRMITRVPDMTRLLDRLERMELIQRVRSQEDRRSVQVRITEEGLEVLGRLDEPVRETHERVLGHMTGEELTQLIRLARKARRSEQDSWRLRGGIA